METFLIQFIRKGIKYNIRNLDEIEQDLADYDSNEAEEFIAQHRDDFAFLLNRAVEVGEQYHSIKRLKFNLCCWIYLQNYCKYFKINQLPLMISMFVY